MPLAGAILARGFRQAAQGRQNATGAVLGTVVAGEDPSLWIRLDTGQEVPQCMGGNIAVGTRVLAFWVNKGHDLAVLALSRRPEG